MVNRNLIRGLDLKPEEWEEELALAMGGTATDLNLNGNPTVILIAGLQGSGNTTFSGKLANHLKNKQGNINKHYN